MKLCAFGCGKFLSLLTLLLDEKAGRNRCEMLSLEGLEWIKLH